MTLILFFIIGVACGVRQDVIIDVPGGEVQFFVTPPSPQKTYVERMASNSTVAELFNAMAKRTKIPLGKFRAVVAQHDLQPKGTLESQGIHDNVDVKMLLDLKGGLANAVKANWGNFDFVVEIRANGGVCTGTIAGYMVLTAAHCVVDKKTGQPLPFYHSVPLQMEPIQVRAYNKPGREFLFIGGTISVHPGYSPGGYTYNGQTLTDNDVAVIALKAVFYDVDARSGYGVPTYGEFSYIPKVVPNLAKDVSHWQAGYLHNNLAGFGLSSTNPEGIFDGLHTGTFVGFPCPPAMGTGVTMACASSNIPNPYTGQIQQSTLASCGGDSGGPWFHYQGSVLTLTGVHSSGMDCTNNPALVNAVSTLTVVGSTSVQNFLGNTGFMRPGWSTPNGRTRLLGSGSYSAFNSQPQHTKQSGYYQPWRGESVSDEPMPLFLGKLGSNVCHDGSHLMDFGVCRAEAARQFGTYLKKSLNSSKAPKGCNFIPEHGVLVFNLNTKSTGSQASMKAVCFQQKTDTSGRPNSNPLHNIFLGQINTIECPGGTQLTDENICRTLATRKLGTSEEKIVSQRFKGSPKGCFFNSQKSIVFFNTDLSSTAPHKRAMPVCTVGFLNRNQD